MVDKFKQSICYIFSIDSGLILLTAFLLTFSFPQNWFGITFSNFGFLIWFAYLPILLSIRNASLKFVFLKTFAAGLLFSTLSLFWICSALYEHAGYPIWLSLICFCFIVIVLGVKFALSFVCAKHISQKINIPLFISLPFSITAFEYVISVFPFGGFPWLSLGYSQYSFQYLIQLSDVFGVFGISFLIILVNVLLYDAVQYFRNRNLKYAYIRIAIVVGLIALNLGYGFVRILTIERSAKDGNEINIVGISANIPQKQKWDPRFRNLIINKYKTLTYEALSGNPDLIVWPETAIPFYLDRNLDIIPSSLVPNANIPLLLGAMNAHPQNKRVQWNGVFFVERNKIIKKYDKVHLVPLAEYIPFNKTIIDRVANTQSGNNYDIFKVRDTFFGVQICFEDVFSSLSRKWAKKGAEFIINVSNDGWYANSSGVLQREMFSVFRAIENRISYIKIANQGISSVVSPTGKLISYSPRGEQFIESEIQPGKYFSPYFYLGEYPLLFLNIVFLIMFLRSLGKFSFNVKALFVKYFKRAYSTIILLFLVFIIPVSLFANEQGDSQNNYTPFQNYSNGEAVELSNGGLVLSYTDLSLPGKGSMDLKVTRSFASSKSVQNEEVEIDHSIFTGFEHPKSVFSRITFRSEEEESDSTNSNIDFGVNVKEKYEVGENINTNLLCAALVFGPWANLDNDEDFNYSRYRDYLPCERNVTVEQFRFQDISSDDLKMQITKAKTIEPALPMKEGYQSVFEEDFLGGPKEINYEKDIYPLGSIKSNGDNLVWVPPHNKWIFSASKYIGAIIFRNIMPFTKIEQFHNPEMITFLIKADGNYEAFNSQGNKMGFTGVAKKILGYYTQNTEVGDLTPVMNDYYNTNAFVREIEDGDGKQKRIGVVRKIFAGSNLAYNDALKLNVDKLILKDNSVVYTFNRYEKLTLYSQLMTHFIDIKRSCYNVLGLENGCCDEAGQYLKACCGDNCQCYPSTDTGDRHCSCCSVYKQNNIFFQKIG